jgi:chromosome segregation ATPase
MKQQLQKLVRLAQVHNQIVDWHLENIAQLSNGLAECAAQHARILQSMEQFQSLGMTKAPNFSKMLQDIKVRRDRLKAATHAAEAEHARVHAIVEKLKQRQGYLRARIIEEELEQTIEEWNTLRSAFSQTQAANARLTLQTGTLS